MILRDPVHGLVSFEGAAESVVPRLMDTPEVQRLRRVRALGVASLAFPGAEHSRFAHAVGAAHVMTRFLARVSPLAAALGPGQGLEPEDAQDALAAALVHDVGHGPLSHLFEEVMPAMPAHETWTSAIVLDPSTGLHRALKSIDPAMPERVERLVHGDHRVRYLARAVSGTFDVDRCDYLLRDSYMTGTRYGLYDLDWLLRSLRLEPSRGGARLAVDGSKGLPAVEGYFLARLFIYQQVYFHKATRGAEAVLRAIFRRLADILGDGRVPAGTPQPLVAFARGEKVSVGAYLDLDDNVLWCAVDAWRADPDPVLSSLAEEIQARVLFKTASLDDFDPADDAALEAGLREVVKKRGFEPRYYASLDVAEVLPYERPTSPDEALRVVYERRPPRALERASFLIARLLGAPFVRRRLVFPASVRDDVDALLGSFRPTR
ncbi:MAG: HD domain-containing protein [Myxococcales bacterium]|nr:HD domain-containing protein [Myxococcales bacterium]